MALSNPYIDQARFDLEMQRLVSQHNIWALQTGAAQQARGSFQQQNAVDARLRDLDRKMMAGDRLPVTPGTRRLVGTIRWVGPNSGEPFMLDGNAWMFSDYNRELVRRRRIKDQYSWIEVDLAGELPKRAPTLRQRLQAETDEWLKGVKLS